MRTYDPQCISNAFGSIYANLGSTLTNKITSSKRSVNYYINNIPRSLNSLVLLPTTGTEVSQIIQRLSNKKNSSHDEINNTLLKKLYEAISHPLLIILNQSISSGIFPDTMKIAEVTHYIRARKLMKLSIINPSPCL